MPSSPDAIKTHSRETEIFPIWLKGAGENMAMLGGFLYWGVFGLFMTAIGGVLHVILPRKTGIRIGRALIHLLFRQFVNYIHITGLVRVDLSALEVLGKLGHPFIAAPNHASLWDAVFILARLPHAVCVMKKSILKNPLLGGGARLAGHIPNDGLTRMIRSASDSLNNGGQLILFPEGTRTDPDTRWVNPLKGGCAIIATRTKVPVYPIFIRSNTRFFQKGWPMWKKPEFPIKIHFELGQAIQPEIGESAQAFTARMQTVFEHELAKPHPLRRQVETPQS